jgi:hypothetical protein
MRYFSKYLLLPVPYTLLRRTPRQALYLNISRNMSAPLEIRMVNTSQQAPSAAVTPAGTPPELHAPKSCTKRAGKQYANAQISASPPAPTTTVASPAAAPAVAPTTSVPDAV